MSSLDINLSDCRVCGCQNENGAVFNNEQNQTLAKQLQTTFSVLVSILHACRSNAPQLR